MKSFLGKLLQFLENRYVRVQGLQDKCEDAEYEPLFLIPNHMAN